MAMLVITRWYCITINVGKTQLCKNTINLSIYVLPTLIVICILDPYYYYVKYP